MGYVQNRTNLLPPTGQTTSYRDGDDGYFQTGNPRDRFIDNGDGTITDRHTGLMWVKQPELIIPGATGVHATNQIQSAEGDWANDTAYEAADLVKDTDDSTYWVCAVGHTSAAAGTFATDRTANPTYWRQTVWTSSAANLTTPATMNWDTAIDDCLALEYVGYSDWRLPNSKELESIYDYGASANPRISAPLTLNINALNSSSVYWTGTTHFVTTKALQLKLVGILHHTGAILAMSKTDDTTQAIPVRGGTINA